MQMALRRIHASWTNVLGWLVVLTLCLLHGVRAFEGCTVRFGRRGCTHRILTGVIVTCDGFGTEPRVPQRLPQDTVYLSLTNFNLSRLVRADFMRFVAVECLAIVDSAVTGLGDDVFADMVKLVEVKLQNTLLRDEHLFFITHPSSERFEALSITQSPYVTRFEDVLATSALNALRSLNLNSNRLNFVSYRVYAQLRNLELLDLSRNRLTRLDWSLFHGHLTKLNQLLLDGNRLQTVPETMHSVFFAVKELTLADNPLHCNCKLRWLKDFYDMAVDKTLDVDSVNCFSPRHVNIRRAPSDSFRCSPPELPHIAWSPTDDTSRVQLNCTSHGDPAPTLTLTLEDGKRVVVPPSERLAEVQTSTPQILTEPGIVHCEASNTDGSSTSSLRIGVIPDLSTSSRLISRLAIGQLVCFVLTLKYFQGWIQHTRVLH